MNAIGDYKHRCTIQSRSGTTDAHGHVSPDWIDRDKRWCHLEDQSGAELYRAQKNDPTVSAIVALREQFTGLTSKHRLVIGDRVFTIKAVLGKSDRSQKHGQLVACGEKV